MSKSQIQISRKTHACTALALAAILALTVFTASAAALPAKFWGVVPQAVPTQEQFQRLHSGGVATVRIPFDWGGLQPTPGPIDWSGTDLLVERAAAAGIE